MIGAFALTGKVPSDILMAIVLLSMGGFTCAELGKRIPIIRNIGAAAIFATFIPSYLAFHHYLPASILASVKDFTKDSNFLYLFISCIIVGSILGMDRGVLIKGFLKIFIPLACGSVAAACVGRWSARCSASAPITRSSLSWCRSWPAASARARSRCRSAMRTILHQPQGDLFAQVLPPVMLGSLTAILLAGTLNFVGKKYPHLTGEGRLQPGEHDELEREEEDADDHVDVADGCRGRRHRRDALSDRRLGAAAVQLPRAGGDAGDRGGAEAGAGGSPSLQVGAFHVYKFFSTAVTYPLLFAIGIALTPWDKLVAAFTLPYVITIVATVVTIIGTGFVVGGWMKMYPIDTAIVTACHSGQGGTGDVAILTAANRMQLMPFAQIATRIGGAATVTWC